jgi:hypothetical protein
MAAPLQAQNPAAQLRVTVVDQTGASITSATVRVTAAGASPIDQPVDGRGQVTFDTLAPGSAQVHVEAAGFAPFDGTLMLRRGGNAQNVTMKIAGVEEQIVVNEDASIADRSGNSMTTTLSEDDIAGLPDDPDELADALDQMTGGAGAVFQVNGFRGGRLPEKSEILQIRFHLNSFSADNHDAGRVIVEIMTKPTKVWGANANLGLRSDVTSTRAMRLRLCKRPSSSEDSMRACAALSSRARRRSGSTSTATTRTIPARSWHNVRTAAWRIS